MSGGRGGRRVAGAGGRESRFGSWKVRFPANRGSFCCRSLRIAVVIIEYGDKWSSTTSQAACLTKGRVCKCTRAGGRVGGVVRKGGARFLADEQGYLAAIQKLTKMHAGNWTPRLGGDGLLRWGVMIGGPVVADSHSLCDQGWPRSSGRANIAPAIGAVPVVCTERSNLPVCQN